MSQAPDPVTLLRSWFLEQWPQQEPPDEAVLEYMADSMGEGSFDEDSLYALIELAASSSEGFGSLPEDARMPLMLDLLHLMLDLHQAVAAKDSMGSTTEMTGQQASASLVQQEDQGGPSRAAGGPSGASSTQCPTQPEPTLTAQEEEAVHQLEEMCQGAVSAPFLAYKLCRCFCGDIQAAVDWLLASDLAADEAVWKAAQASQQQYLMEQAAADKKMKKQVLDRFDMLAIKMADTSSRKAQPQLNVLGGAQQASKVRYREGQVVASRGEKFVIEKSGLPEWDGGSTGKVKTKGKRGKGFA
mmetsp:Transcript_7136/g.12295  ORF Transcript_7136/g.12295 Transcript_7136/m.12295 type:complete len:300 (+) Transcript_7136:133-1032(+)|eukprot:CAMPEP_0119102098 /NCGR_PEP_ID=MMETSP1180-20130426/962_1 /TAXON_ID=3052 ORGANISM="Chlamydomonas cf sp, Strain CCMP681" /NCGR_SAMPLE_ID=MMETSP1180 /ASSEMBLY_ACC=CAM_ASM_000741 /LENGTH=299 /DNA_ID=CAMNT_0007086325 /DNA_START=78 /DNA_END=977 /DNA_ORIENTATION=+